MASSPQIWRPVSNGDVLNASQQEEGLYDIIADGWDDETDYYHRFRGSRTCLSGRGDGRLASGKNFTMCAAAIALQSSPPICQTTTRKCLRTTRIGRFWQIDRTAAQLVTPSQ
jgi:hypothetical protein